MIASNPNDVETEVARLTRQLARERVARQEAESIAECSTRELYDQQQRLMLLQAMVVAANEATDAAEALGTALRRVCAFTGWSVGHVYLGAEDETGELVPTTIWHLKDPKRFEELRRITERTRFAPGAGLPGKVLRSGQSIWITDLGHDANSPRAKLLQQLHFKTGVGCPLLVANKVVGVLEFFSEVRLEPDEDLLEIMLHVGTQVGRVIERQRSHGALQRSEEYFRRLTENALDVVTVFNADGTIRYQSPSIRQVLGYPPEDFLGKHAADFIHPEESNAFAQALNSARQKHGNTPLLTFRFRHKDGSWRTFEGSGNNLLDDAIVTGIVFNSRDITERKRLEEQFLQSQKVQAIGQLAGGVAHDFNNILTAIIGYTDLLLKRLPARDGLSLNAQEIKKAANRAASLTRQLLAFSRKQVLQPRVLDLNGVVSDMDKMLRRLLGEHIGLVTLPQGDLGRVKADPGQIEQVIMNLAVNARDAMPGHGKLTIETANVVLDAQYCRQRPEATPGEYVMLAISDNGGGMSPEVKARLFEPFFTTKELGKGTGLGLATCHGIVKQSGGHIHVYSEVGRGTTFKVYLPRVYEAIEPLTRCEAPSVPSNGTETVMLVEDEPMLRELGLLVLSGLGYRVLPADNGVQALRLLDEHRSQNIHVLVTDVVMPEMGGKELAERLREISPETKVLFCSGYTEDAILHEGILNRGVSFIQKPYTIATLANKVREVLDVAA